MAERSSSVGPKRGLAPLGAVLLAVVATASSCTSPPEFPEPRGTSGQDDDDSPQDVGPWPAPGGSDASSDSTGAHPDSTGSHESGAEADPGGLPDGENCDEHSDCASSLCYDTGILGGYCGECLTEDDCPNGGCTIPNPLAEPPTGALCNDGSFGGGCNTNAGCQLELTCSDVIEVPGLGYALRGCGDCQSDADCGGGTQARCVPQIEFETVTGGRTCITPGGLAIGSSCDPQDDGDSWCASGHCDKVTIFPGFDYGVCGQCKLDEDCELGQTCVGSSFGPTTGMVPSACRG